jgi:hypothetical protein
MSVSFRVSQRVHARVDSGTPSGWCALTPGVRGERPVAQRKLAHVQRHAAASIDPDGAAAVDRLTV